MTRAGWTAWWAGDSAYASSTRARGGRARVVGAWLVAVVTAGCGGGGGSAGAGSASAGTGGATGGCQKDTDCKGARICVNGMCTSPGAGGSGSTSTGATTATGSSSTGGGSATATASSTVASSSSGGGAGGAASSSSSASATGSGTGGAGGMHGTGGAASSSGTGGGTVVFDVEPAMTQTITVQLGQTMPTVTYTATLGGSPASATWSVDQGSLGTIPQGPASTAAFTPTGKVGGPVDVLASLNGQTLERPIVVQIVGQQNGGDPTNPAEAPQIACVAGGAPPCNPTVLQMGGGIGGVGGEGLGGAVASAGTLGALGAPAGDGKAQGLALLYPYDKTVWPRGTRAPLLMWSWAPGDADAIEIAIHDQAGYFRWTGTFARPDILSATPPPTTGTSFVRHPIPQDVWDAATSTASGPSNPLTVSLTVAKGGVAYGPVSETWIVAPARLPGSIYYNAYATQLVKNWVNSDKAGNVVGAAILSVRSGNVAPQLVAGQNSPLNAQGKPLDDTGCRACHVVASRGRWLITQAEQGNPGDGLSYLYDLSQGSSVALAAQGTFAWAGLTGDASYALTNMVNPSSSNPAVGGVASAFWSVVPAQAAQTLTGLPSGLAAGYPAYSPDGTRVAYVDATGSPGDIQGKPIVVASFDAATNTFSNVKTVVSPIAGQQLRLGYPVFLPDGSGLLFESQVRKGCSDTVMVTRNGTRSELWWTDLASDVSAPLVTLNGKGYLPTGAGNHGAGTVVDPENCGMSEAGLDDTTLGYEPSVAPIVAGGYAWVVITSRRLYGNELTSTPWQSWPPDYDTTNLAQASVKKLWVAAIDLGAAPGTDPSHPAFYLPAQEILGANARGVWVLDPCAADGASCATGDQCCGGYCEAGAGGALVCASAPSACAAPQEKCASAADCCDPTNLCINGFCALAKP